MAGPAHANRLYGDGMEQGLILRPWTVEEAGAGGEVDALADVRGARGREETGVENKEARGIDGHLLRRANSDPAWSEDLSCHASSCGHICCIECESVTFKM